MSVVNLNELEDCNSSKDTSLVKSKLFFNWFIRFSFKSNPVTYFFAISTASGKPTSNPMTADFNFDGRSCLSDILC